ncbi:MAG: hypothetical protein IJ681_03235 [Bacteroidales bacterium]|nr:hypothetical protein [Bacteroidales bacterium]
MKNNIYKYVCLYAAYILFSCNSLSAQQKTASYDLFTRATDNTTISKFNGNTSDKLLMEEVFSSSKYFTITDLGKNITDTVLNTPVMYINCNDTFFYYHSVQASAAYYIQDTLFITFGYGLMTYVRKNNHFESGGITYFNTDKRFYNIIGYKDGKLILGNQRFEGEFIYGIASYDVRKNIFINEYIYPAGTSVLLNYNDIFNAFASNGKFISVMHLINPVIHLLDYDLNLIDTVNFTVNDDFRLTKRILDTNVAVNKHVLSADRPKEIIMFLDKINILDYYSNTKQIFINDSVLLILTRRMQSDTCDIIKLNIRSKAHEIIRSYPEYGYSSPYVHLNIGDIVPLFDDGTFIGYNTRLDSTDENFIYYINCYKSDLLSVDSNTLLLEDRKNQLQNVNLDNYDNIIVFDEYFCKSCFEKKARESGILFIFKRKVTDKKRKLSII